MGVDVNLELTTPTGAALIKGLAESVGPLPDMTITGSGYGAGTRDLLDRANVTQVIIGTAPETDSAPDPRTETVIELAKQQGIKVVEREIYPDEIQNADEIFLTGSAVEVTPVGKINDQTFEVGDITSKILNSYMKEVDPNYQESS